MKQKQVVKKIFRYVFITFTAALYAVGIALFLNPNNLAPGGISGIAIILKKMFQSWQWELKSLELNLFCQQCIV